MIKSVEWDYFKLKDLFDINYGKFISSHNNFSLGDDYKTPYITTTNMNNGVMRYVNVKPVYSQEALTVATDGTIGECFYQPEPFVASNITAILKPNFFFDKYIAFFLITIIKKERYRYSYGRKWSINKVRETIIKLPIDNQGNPNWSLMRNYIKNLSNNNLNKLSEPQIIKKTFLTDRKWVHFKVLDLFEIRRGLRLTKERREEGEIPFITAGELNSGVSAHIKHNIVNVKYESDISITMDMFGNAFARNYIFGYDDNVYTLKNKNMNIFNSIFISTIIKQNKYRYSYGRQCRLKNINIDIKLPVDKQGNPDWQFMEDYIKSLPYTKYL